MAKQFTYMVKTPAKDLVRVIEEKLQGQMVLTGDEKSGKMEGKGFKGRYQIEELEKGTKVSLIIDQKPWMISWVLIQSKMDAMARTW